MLIEFKAVSLKRAGRPVLQDLELSLQEHRIGIIGDNGAGKSRAGACLKGFTWMRDD